VLLCTCALTSPEVVVIRVVVDFYIPPRLERISLFLLLLYRRLRYGYAFRLIELTRGKFAIVDTEDYHRLKKHKWHAHKSPHTYYAVKSLTNGKKQKRINMYMHHLVVNVTEAMKCDHINHNGLDNRKANLRIATHTQNVWNRRKFKTPSRSKYKGVDWVKDIKRWRARITVDGRRLHLGFFRDEVDAAKAYDQAAREYHKEFAALNFP
jgi:hypothetical protein